MRCVRLACIAILACYQCEADSLQFRTHLWCSAAFHRQGRTAGHSECTMASHITGPFAQISFIIRKAFNSCCSQGILSWVVCLQGQQTGPCLKGPHLSCSSCQTGHSPGGLSAEQTKQPCCPLLLPCMHPKEPCCLHRSAQSLPATPSCMFALSRLPLESPTALVDETYSGIWTCFHRLSSGLSSDNLLSRYSCYQLSPNRQTLHGLKTLATTCCLDHHHQCRHP